MSLCVSVLNYVNIDNTSKRMQAVLFNLPK